MGFPGKWGIPPSKPGIALDLKVAHQNSTIMVPFWLVGEFTTHFGTYSYWLEWDLIFKHTQPKRTNLQWRKLRPGAVPVPDERHAHGAGRLGASHVTRRRDTAPTGAAPPETRAFGVSLEPGPLIYYNWISTTKPQKTKNVNCFPKITMYRSA